MSSTTIFLGRILRAGYGGRFEMGAGYGGRFKNGGRLWGQVSRMTVLNGHNQKNLRNMSSTGWSRNSLFFALVPYQNLLAITMAIAMHKSL